MRVTFDGSGVPNDPNLPPDPDRYHVMVDSVEGMRTKSSNVPMAKIKYKIVHGEKTGLKFQGRPITDFLVFGQQDFLKWRLKRMLQALNLYENAKMQVDTDQWVHKQLFIDTEPDEYQGRKRLKITDFVPLPPTGSHPLAPTPEEEGDRQEPDFKDT